MSKLMVWRGERGDGGHRVERQRVVVEAQVQRRGGGVFSARELRAEGENALRAEAMVLRGVSMITRGEHRGWGMWGDAALVARVVELCNAEAMGLKCRFTHPGLSADGLGTYMGRLRDARVVGDCAVADLYLAESARRSPQGDLIAYVQELAGEDPRALATSVVYERDVEAFEAFHLARGAKWATSEWGGEYLDLSGFVSPDPDNVDNLPHDVVGSLHACDLVDEPAANPGGLFAPVAELGARVEEVALVALGLRDGSTAALGAGVTPRGARAWASAFLERHGLAVVPVGTVAPGDNLDDGRSEMATKAKRVRRAVGDPDEEGVRPPMDETEPVPPAGDGEGAPAPEGEDPEEEEREEDVDTESASYRAGFEAGLAEAARRGDAQAESGPMEEERSRPATIEELEALTGASAEFVLRAFKAGMTELDAARELLRSLTVAPRGASVVDPQLARRAGGVAPVAVGVVQQQGQPTTFEQALEVVRSEARAKGRTLGAGEDASEVRVRWPALYSAAVENLNKRRGN